MKIVASIWFTLACVLVWETSGHFSYGLATVLGIGTIVIFIEIAKTEILQAIQAKDVAPAKDDNHE